MNTSYDITSTSNTLLLNSSTGSVKRHFSIAEIISSIEEMNNKMRNADNVFSINQSVNEFDSANKIFDKKSDAAKKNRKKSIVTSSFAGANALISCGLMLGASGFEKGFSSTSRKCYKDGHKEHSELSNNLHEAKFGKSIRNYDNIEKCESALSNHLAAFKAENGYDFNTSKHKGLFAISQHADLISGITTSIGEGCATKAAIGASADERQAELDGTFERFFEKDAESFSSKARAVSQQTMQAVESLVGVLAKLQDAMTLK
jgi:hypothetical protein